MRRGVKIVTIGGGSSYTPELVDGFLKRYESLPVRELWPVLKMKEFHFLTGFWDRKPMVQVDCLKECVPFR